MLIVTFLRTTIGESRKEKAEQTKCLRCGQGKFSQTASICMTRIKSKAMEYVPNEFKNLTAEVENFLQSSFGSTTAIVSITD